MTDCNARDCDKWVMVDDSGQRTLFQLVEMGKGADAVRLANELPARAIVVDITLPALPALDEKPASHAQSESSRLILLNVRTVTGDDPNGAMRIERARPEPARITDAASPGCPASPGRRHRPQSLRANPSGVGRSPRQTPAGSSQRRARMVRFRN
jgi:hypothetical protein